MNEFSEYLMKMAEPKINPHHVFYRQFFPASPIVRIKIMGYKNVQCKFYTYVFIL